MTARLLFQPPSVRVWQRWTAEAETVHEEPEPCLPAN
jgi:hypothetical protein